MEPDEFENYLEQSKTPAAPSNQKINAGTLYELNQGIYSQKEAIKIEDIPKGNLRSWLKRQPTNTYYMLLCNELRYYTVFHITERKNLVREVVDLVKDLGAIKGFEKDEASGAFTVWIDYENKGQAHCFFFFPYDQGVVEV